MPDCEICCETLNAMSRKPIPCINAECELKVCRSCVQTYIINENEIPKCMGCNKIWDNDWLIKHMSKTFYSKPLKAHTGKILWEGQLSKMPETQEYISNLVESERIMSEFYKLSEERDKLRRQFQLKDRELIIKMDAITAKRRELQLKPGEQVQVKKKKSGTGFIRACTSENCRGYLNSNWFCGLCETTTCKDCMKYLDNDEEHVCNDDDKATAELLLKSSKPCPKCKTGISKIDGCDQMWCSDCHTTFSWNTGAISTGHTHNPHYFEFLRNTGANIPRNPGDNPCGLNPDEINTINIVNKLSRLTMTPTTEQLAMIDSVLKCAAMIQHIEGVELARGGRWNMVERDFLKERVSYLKKETDMTEGIFMKILVADNIRRERAQSVNLILRTFIFVAKAIILEFQNTDYERQSENTDKLLDTNMRLSEIRDHTNIALQNHSALHNIVPVKIHSTKIPNTISPHMAKTDIWGITIGSSTQRNPRLADRR